ncbi:hypothetical protein ACLMJK_006323 [Lecanora helva]
MSSTDEAESTSSTPESLQSLEELAQSTIDDSPIQEGTLESYREDGSDASSSADSSTLSTGSESFSKLEKGKKPDVTRSRTEPGEQYSDQSSEDETNAPTRPNKFNGPASTWRNWTAPERGLAASLDQLTAKDLSVHLYNAFMLRKRQSTSHNQQQPQGDLEPEVSGTDRWKPPKLWTAWPLPPSDVPRDDEGKRWEEDSPQSRLSVNMEKPSQMLDDMLVAQILRLSRKKFEQRNSEDPLSEKDNSQPEPHKGQSTETSNEDSKDDVKAQRPVIMTDDERANEILHSTVRHILTELDCLLIALHRSRASYLPVKTSVIEPQEQVSQSSSHRRPRKRMRTASSDNPGDVPMLPASNGSEGEGQFKKKCKERSKSPRGRSNVRSIQDRKVRLGLRDWSEILGFASLVGWDPNVVNRAAARCASLFGEGMTFRTLKEGYADFTECTYLPNENKPSRRPHNSAIENHSDSEGDEQLIGGVHGDGFLQPIEAKKSWKYSNKRSSPRSKSQKSKSR